MKKSFAFIAAAAVLCLAACESRTVAEKPFGPSQSILLYPQGQTVDAGIVEDGVTVTLGPGEDNELRGPEIIKGNNGDIYNVNDSARMEFFFPEKSNGLMVVNCPGGGYTFVSNINEGLLAAEWLTCQGVTVCNLVYRLPNHHPAVPLIDVQNAFRYCRAHAAGWGIDKIGVMGGSAGGHLAAMASTLYIDSITRPDFTVLLYPVASFDYDITHHGTHDNLLPLGYKVKPRLEQKLEKKGAQNPLPADLEAYYSPENQVTPETPATFIALSADDPAVPPACSFRYFDSLAENGVYRQLHVYPAGGHGWGFNHEPYYKERLQAYRPIFQAELAQFLKDRASAIE